MQFLVFISIMNIIGVLIDEEIIKGYLGIPIALISILSLITIAYSYTYHYRNMYRVYAILLVFSWIYLYYYDMVILSNRGFAMYGNVPSILLVIAGLFIMSINFIIANKRK